MPKGVAKDQMTDAQVLGLGRYPGGNAHCLPDVFVGEPGRLEVIDKRHSVETTRLGMARPFRDVGRRQSHLRQEEIPLDHAPTCARADCNSAASLLFLLC